jgi:benzoyl-CoA reductase subunit C
VAVHSCDPQEKTARIWEHYAKYSYFHFIDMPATLYPESINYFRGQLRDFQTTLEEFAGQEMSGPKLARAIEEHNRQRQLVRNLYDLTKPDPPLISGTEILQVTKALMSLPVGEGNELVQQVIREVRERKDKPLRKASRLLIWTATLDDASLMGILEERAHVVIDDNCAGLRPFRGSVKASPDPLEELANYYLKGITCARTFREVALGDPQKSFFADLQNRFGFLKERAEAWKVDGVLLFLVRYCDPFAFEMMELKDYLDLIGLASIYIEHDNTQGGLAPLKTRVEAFLETLQAKR